MTRRTLGDPVTGAIGPASEETPNSSPETAVEGPDEQSSPILEESTSSGSSESAEFMTFLICTP